MRSITIASSPQWDGMIPAKAGVDADDANELLYDALEVTGDMLAQDEEGAWLVDPPEIDRLIVAKDLDKNAVLAWLSLSEIPDSES